ncbi:rhomboid family intramembrane serine protease [Seonamhaeicola sediminis]|uniref:Rhomboid family intramembrane serine protease n=1 Tax=Seonamhaeicola sediminis TaxID=2528206 RepID=A0A562YD85_9FLAO|nr:rhomboid family intramembrane serine protease [Seonamhaeicola sediminis]TWO32550.1 rhomboid family intramembrane serine protease [Seonamhaeicola sediminis]
MMRISETVKHLLIINVIMFIGTLAIGGGELFYDWFALRFPQNEGFQLWQILTHMFMHGGWSHLFFNMFALWMFGTPVEQVLGSKRFLFIYFSAGLGAVVLQLLYYYFKFYSGLSLLEEAGFNQVDTLDTLKSGYNMYDTRWKSALTNQQLADFVGVFNSSMVGASGCLMGILAAFGMMNPNAELMLIFLPIPIKAKYFIPGLIALDLISGISGQSIFGYGNVAHFAHVGGALTGFLIMWYWKKNQFNQNRWY